jgi:hypothetical protein
VAHHQKALKLWRLPNIEKFTPNVNTSVPILCALVKVPKGQRWVEHMDES